MYKPKSRGGHKPGRRAAQAASGGAPRAAPHASPALLLPAAAPPPPLLAARNARVSRESRAAKGEEKVILPLTRWDSRRESRPASLKDPHCCESLLRGGRGAGMGGGDRSGAGRRDVGGRGSARREHSCSRPLPRPGQRAARWAGARRGRRGPLGAGAARRSGASPLQQHDAGCDDGDGHEAGQRQHQQAVAAALHGGPARQGGAGGGR
jgi:hypothetical protein